MTASQATDLMQCIRQGEFVLMDGALGTELERRGVPFESEGWSALAVRDYGEIVRQVHADYIEAGAKLHIVNSCDLRLIDMFMHSRRFIIKVAILLLTVLILLPVGVDRVAAQSAPALSDEALVQMLRKGGFNIYFRHAATDWSQSDEVNGKGDWLSCDSSRMRQLSAEGRQTSIDIGEFIRALGLPVGKVMASPYCRTVETAKLMQLGAVESTTDVMNLRVASYFGGRAVIIGNAQKRLSTRPAAGTNTVIVAHGNVAQAATPVYPGEGEAVIFEPDGDGGFRYIARIAPEDWSRIITRLPR